MQIKVYPYYKLLCFDMWLFYPNRLGMLNATSEIKEGVTPY